MATYSSFSSIGVSTPFLMKHRGLKIALRGYQCTQPTNGHVRHDDRRGQSRELPCSLGLLSSIFGAFSFTGKQTSLRMVNTRPTSPLFRYPNLQTGVPKLALVPTRRSTSGLGTSGAAAPRNGATKRGSQARTARKAPPVAWTPSYTSIRGTDISCSWLVRPEVEARSRRQLAAYRPRDARGSTQCNGWKYVGIRGFRKYEITSLPRGAADFCLVGTRTAIGLDSNPNHRLRPVPCSGNATLLRPRARTRPDFMVSTTKRNSILLSRGGYLCTVLFPAPSDPRGMCTRLAAQRSAQGSSNSSSWLSGCKLSSCRTRPPFPRPDVLFPIPKYLGGWRWCARGHR